MEKEQLKSILEAVLMAASSPLTVDALLNVFEENQRPEPDELKAALEELANECEARSYELKQVSSGYRFQVKKDYADAVSRLWEEKPARYSRALLETLALIAYRQPITRGEIESVRGVSVSSHIIKTLDERNWIKVVGHRDVPGKPALYATTKEFLDYFNLASLDDLPSLQDIRDIDEINAELDLRLPDAAAAAAESSTEGNAEAPTDNADTPPEASAEADTAEQTDSPTEAADDGDQPVSEADENEGMIGLEVADEMQEDHGDSEPAATLEQESESGRVISLDAAEESDDEGVSDPSSSEAGGAGDGEEHRNAAPAGVEH